MENWTTLYGQPLNKGFSCKYPIGYPDQHTAVEGLRAQRTKICDNNNKDLTIVCRKRFLYDKEKENFWEFGIYSSVIASLLTSVWFGTDVAKVANIWAKSVE